MANINVDSFIKVKNSTGGFDTIFPITKGENVKLAGDKALTEKIAEMDTAIDSKIAKESINVANGVVGLNGNGLIPSQFIPAEFKEIEIVETIAERDAVTNLFAGKSVYVKDATGDASVNSGGAYYLYDGTAWIKTAEAESMDIVLDFSQIQNLPTTLGGYGITDGVNVSEVVNSPAPNKLLRLDGEGKFTADTKGNANTASKLLSARNIKVEGDAIEANVEFDGSKDIILPIALKASGVTAGTYVKVTVDERGIVTGAGVLDADDIPGLDYNKIVSGKPTTLSGYGITDAVNIAGGTLQGHLSLHADPTDDMHATTKQYVDSVVQGLDVKQSVKVATVEQIELKGLLTVDGIELVAGDRVLVKDQADKKQNGIYVVSATAWVRAIDADSSAKVTSGMFTFVEEGTVNNNAGFVLSTDVDVVLGVTELEFSKFSGAGQIIAGVGLAKDGNTIYLGNTGVAAGSYTKVTVDEQGRVTVGEALQSSDLPEITWDMVTGRPNSSVVEIDDAVAKKHEHANKATIDKIAEADNRATFNGKAIAFQDETYLSAVSATEPGKLSVGGTWYQTV